MGWKNLPTWLKGGIIGGGILLILSLLISLGHSLKIGIIEFFSSIIWLLLMFPGARQLCSGGLFGSGGCKIGFSEQLIAIAVWFILGSIIGFVVGKIRKKK